MCKALSVRNPSTAFLLTSHTSSSDPSSVTSYSRLIGRQPPDLNIMTPNSVTLLGVTLFGVMI